jgi:hypothetical protein
MFPGNAYATGERGLSAFARRFSLISNLSGPASARGHLDDMAKS